MLHSQLSERLKKKYLQKSSPGPRTYKNCKNVGLRVRYKARSQRRFKRVAWTLWMAAHMDKLIPEGMEKERHTPNSAWLAVLENVGMA